MLLKIIEGVTHINPKVLKALAITSNVLLVIGIICLIMLKLMLAIAFFVVSLTISLVIFNVMFRHRTGMKIAINVSFFIAVSYTHLTLPTKA